jgi:hypothetical protein
MHGDAGGEVRMMMHRVASVTAAAAVLLATQLFGSSAGAAPVNRPLADALTRQFNRQELQQLRSGDSGAYSRPYGHRLRALPQAGMSRAGASPHPVWGYLGH